jgi:hypothetical protein
MENEKKKTPRLDVSYTAQAGQREEVGRVMAELKTAEPGPLVHEKSGTLNHTGQNFENALNEQRKEMLRTTDPYFAAEEERQRLRDATKQRALALDARLHLLRIQIPSTTSPFRAFGEVCPEVQAMVGRTLNALNVDVIDIMHSSGLDGAERLIENHETKIVPALRETCQALQNQFMQRLANERAETEAAKATTAAQRLAPDQALPTLEAAGLRFRLNGAALEIGGGRGLDETERKIVELHKPAIIAALKERDQWKRI